MNLLNTSWYNPTTDLFTLGIIILITLIVEGGLLAFYSWRKKYGFIDSIVIVGVTLMANLLTGVIGYLLQWML